MDHQAFAQLLGNYGEFVGAIAVVVTLGYLAIQIRQSARSVRISAETALSHHVAAWSVEVVRDPNLGRIWDVAATDPDSLTDDEKRQYLWYIAMLFELYEGQFHLFIDGHIPERSWMAKARFLLKLLDLPLAKVWWRSEISPLSTDFIDYLDELKASGIKFPKHGGVLSDLN